MYILILLIFNSLLSHATTLNVITTIPDLAEIVRELGNNTVKVESLLDGSEDPHFLDASPYFISKAANADLFCIIGLELEIGWAPKVLQKSANKNIQIGSKGYCDTSLNINTLDVPTSKIDRSMGDVHRSGNPHYNLSPDALIQASLTIRDKLIALAPEHKVLYTNNQNKFAANMKLLKTNIQNKIRKKIKIIQYHKEFNYFLELYNITYGMSIEEVPGVPPSTTELAKIAINAKHSNISLAIGSHYTPEKHLKKFTEISSIPSIKLPSMVNLNNTNINSIKKLQHYLADSILTNIKKTE